MLHPLPNAPVLGHCLCWPAGSPGKGHESAREGSVPGCCALPQARMLFVRGKETAWVAHHFSLPSSHNSISLLMMKVKWGPPPVPASWKQNRRRAQRAAAASSLLGNAWCVWGAASATLHSRDGTCEAWSPTEGQRESWSVGTCLAPPWFQDPCHLVIAGWCHNRSLTLCILHGESMPSS